MPRKLPLVVILGATGCGKTKLSLELAQHFCGEVIGADSMQVYKSLDIITAKATKDEQSAAPHHLIDILEPHENFSVLEYRNKALSIVDDLLNKNKLPIIVGGTNYYIESLLWKILVDSPGIGANFSRTPGILPNNEHELPSEELHKKLALLDPNMARRLHPNNKRKILRSLEVLYQKGKRHSDILAEQQSSKGGSKTGGGLRYVDSLVLWLQCEQNILDERLDARVDSMIQQGLVTELTDFHQKYVKNRLDSNEDPDYTKGILQSIGFKEFHSYLKLDDPARDTEGGAKLLSEGINQLKIATRRYSRKQAKWIINRFLGRRDREVPPLYGLDTSDVTKWNQCVTVPAVNIVQSFIKQSECRYERLPFLSVNSTPNSEDNTFVCSDCDRVFVGEHQWSVHQKSNNHKRMVERLHRQQLKLQVSQLQRLEQPLHQHSEQHLHQHSGQQLHQHSEHQLHQHSGPQLHQHSEQKLHHHSEQQSDPQSGQQLNQCPEQQFGQQSEQQFYQHSKQQLQGHSQQQSEQPIGHHSVQQLHHHSEQQCCEHSEQQFHQHSEKQCHQHSEQQFQWHSGQHLQENSKQQSEPS